MSQNSLPLNGEELIHSNKVKKTKKSKPKAKKNKLKGKDLEKISGEKVYEGMSKYLSLLVELDWE